MPGWSEPPLKLRIRRLIPIMLPIGLILALLGWSFLVRQPQINRVRISYSPLVALNDDINQLNIECSDQRAGELVIEAGEASRMILPSIEAAPEYLQDLRKTVNRYGWLATFKSYEPVSGPTDEETPITFVPAAGKMIPTRENRKPFPSLLELLTHFTASANRIDLTRLAIGVDEKTGPTVEMNFQIASHRTDEKTAQ
ncbi:MAG: hypothetical protein DRP71_03260 [Verrucomicrobia bacterium]|nr:MAG: hypothetical protein DRP71_03260 [Verrucomicrobiota bacterium]